MKDLFLPQLGHVGFIVSNADKMAELYPAEEVRVYDFIPTRAWSYGKSIYDCKLRIALVSPAVGGTKLEFVQFISGTNTPHESFFKQYGSSIHHIAYYVDNYDEIRSFCENGQDTRIIFEAEIEDAALGKRSSFYMEHDDYPCIIEFSKRPTKI